VGIFYFLNHISQGLYGKTVENAQHFCDFFSVFTQTFFSQVPFGKFNNFIFPFLLDK